jgi:hypothetical protein
MKRLPLLLIGVTLSAAPLHSASADSSQSAATKHDEESHAAVTDIPDIIDMSHADPKTWHSLPPAPQTYVLTQESQFAFHLTARTRPF